MNCQFASYSHGQKRYFFCSAAYSQTNQFERRRCALLEKIERAIWSWPLLLLILGSGVWLNIRLRGFPLRRLSLALRLIFKRSEKGGISPFAALCIALSATVGTGNIVGVATAIVLGGAGALLWMNVGAVVSMSVKYAECMLAVRFHEKTADGCRGGPFLYLRQIRGRTGKLLAGVFAVCGCLAGLLGVGTFVQINSVTSGLDRYLSHCLPALLPRIRFLGCECNLLIPLVCGVLTVLAAWVIRGGPDKIAGVSAVLVPLMAGLYLLLCLWIILANAGQLPALLGRISREAFCPQAACGGLLGVVSAGISRGIFSNEAGLGTAPIASAASAGAPVEQGLVGMTANLFDTVLICSMTGLAVLITGADRCGLTGTAVTLQAFESGLPLPAAVSQGAVLLCLLLFGFTTVVGWSFYGTECLDYLTHGNRTAKKIWLTLYVATVFFAPYLKVETVWTAANICNGLMAAPNLIGLLLLGGVIAKQTRRYCPPRRRVRLTSRF